MAQTQDADVAAPGNEEAVRAWDTVLYERWKKNRKVFVGALDEVTDEAFALYPPPQGGRCMDIGCGFGETTRQMAGLVGPEGFALGTDSSPRFIEDALREAAEAGAENVEFEAVDTQAACSFRTEFRHHLEHNLRVLVAFSYPIGLLTGSRSDHECDGQQANT